MIGVFMSNLFSRSSLRANIVTVAMAAFFLAACGGDGNKANEPDPSAEADFVVDSFDDLSVCIGNREGATAYVKNENNAYICTNGDWAIDTNADTRKKSSSSKDEANSSNIKDKVKSSSSRCEDCKDDAKSSNSKDKAKSSSSRHSEDSSSSRHCEDCKDEAISSSSSVGQKTAWEYLNPNIDYGEIVDDRDCQTYKTVKIGDQVWMAENLNFETENSWCGGGKDSIEGDCSKYGRLYTWAAANDACPEGWHLPDTTEWNKLFTAVGGKSTAGKKLKSQSGWKDYGGTSGNGTDVYGFSAFPAGYRSLNGLFYDEGYYAYFWSATEGNSNYAYYMFLYYYDEGAYLYNINKSYAFPVRCLKN